MFQETSGKITLTNLCHWENYIFRMVALLFFLSFFVRKNSNFLEVSMNREITCKTPHDIPRNHLFQRKAYSLPQCDSFVHSFCSMCNTVILGLFYLQFYAYIFEKKLRNWVTMSRRDVPRNHLLQKMAYTVRLHDSFCGLTSWQFRLHHGTSLHVPFDIPWRLRKQTASNEGKGKKDM